MNYRAFCTFFFLLTASLSGILAGNAPVCTLGMVTTSDSIAIVPVRVRNFTNIGACDLKVGFSSEVASFEKITFGNGVNFPAFSVNKELVNQGIIRCGGYFNSGVTLSDGSVFLYFHFKKKSTGSAALTFIDDEDSYSCLFYDIDLNPLTDVPFGDHYVNGLLSFTPEKVAPVTVIPSVKACQGEIVELPVTVRGFAHIGMVTLAIGYDQNVLTQPAFTNTSGVMSLAADLSAPGQIKISGLTVDQEGATLADGSIFFTLSFTYIGGESAVQFTHVTTADCQYKTPSPGFQPINDLPKATFFNDGSVAQAAFSGYSLTCSATAEVCSGESAEISATLASTIPAGQCPLTNGLLKINATGPGDVTFQLRNGDQSHPEFVNSGSWGPPGGFVLTPEFLLSIQGHVQFSSPGEYSIYFSVEDVLSDTMIAGLSASVKISVLEAFSAGAIATSGEQICAGDPPTKTIEPVKEAGGGDGSIFYQWQSGAVSDTEGFIDIPGAVSRNFRPTGPLNRTTWYRRMVRDNQCHPAFVPSSGIWKITVDPCGVTVKGTLRYLNAALTPLKGVTFYFISEGDTAYSVKTDQAGNYEIPSVMPGNYMVLASFPIYETEAVNAVDAGSVINWKPGVLPALEKARFKAGDVNGDRVIDSHDALLMNSFFLQGGKRAWPDSMTSWSFWKSGDLITGNPFPDGTDPVIQVGISPVNQDFYGMVRGDFNMGFVPGLTDGAMDEGPVRLIDGEVVTGMPGEEFVLPISTSSATKVGAFSLILRYPRESVEVVSVFRGTDQKDTIPFNITNDQLRISWYGSPPLDSDMDHPLISLMIKVHSGVAVGEEVRFSLVPGTLNELADEEMKVLSRTYLLAGRLRIVSTGSEKAVKASGFGLRLYPNPAHKSFNLTYTVPAEGLVTLRLVDTYGRVVKFMQMDSVSGENQLRVDLPDCLPGIYFVRLDYFNVSGISSLSERLLIWY